MAESAVPSSGRIFINYRREESAYPAGWLFDRLEDHFGEGQVFKDVDSIELGDDFVEVVSTAVGSCDVLLALIGNEWLTITDQDGRRRLDNADDFVRLEIEAALRRKVLVVPVLVEGARMPRADELPDSLASLARRQALELSPSRFDFDTGRLLRVLDKTLAEVRTAREDSGSTRADQPGVPTRRVGPPPLDRKEPPEKRRLSRRARIFVGAAVFLVPVLVIVTIVTNSGQTGEAPHNSVTPTRTAKLSAVFEDGFSSRAAGWHVESDSPAGGTYTNLAYRITAEPVKQGGLAVSTPWNVTTPFPPDLRITVQARRIGGSDRNMDYGIVCRVGSAGGYLFTVSDDYALIVKFGSSYEELREAGPPVNAYANNRLQAECTSDEGQQAVHLVFTVNGRVVAEATDEDQPYLKGTVGLGVGIAPPATSDVLAEFDNFVVTQPGPAE